MEFRLLGCFEVHRAGERVQLGGHRQRAVLALLALEANRPVSAEALADRLWAGDPPAGVGGTLQAYISNLRRLLEPDRAPRSPAGILTSTANGYRLVIPEGARDVDRFTAHARAARAALAARDPATAERLAQQALSEWRGPALADLADEPFAAADILRLEEARLQTLELRFEAQLALGDHSEIVAELTSLVETLPLRERLRGQLMLALYRCGRQADALEVARIGRERLAEELGLDPDPANRQLEAAILRQDVELIRPVAATSPGVDVPPVPATPAVDAQGHGTAGIVGRTEEREVLARALGAVAHGSGRVVLVGGEPGIGKTRLAEAFAREVAGAQVLWGRCQETGGAPPFWPWRQVLRSLTTELEPSRLRSVLGADAGLLIDVAPELAGVIGETAPVRIPDADTARFHFFDAVTRLLTTAARTRPLVLVLDDIHWADPSSMALLRFVVGAVRDQPLLLLATYRDVAVTDRRLLTETLGALAREPVVERLLLPGLDGEESTTLVARLLGQVPDRSLVDTVLDRTGGNPLFLIHLAPLLRAAIVAERPEVRDAILAEVPPAVIDLIGLRVAEQPEPTRRSLEIAAVVGRRFELDLLVQVEPRSFDEALAAIQPAVAAGLVVEDDVPGIYCFTHALMREAIVAGMGRTRAGRLHGLIGDALAARGTDDRPIAIVAHHYWRASRLGWADEALRTATAAAAAAIAGLAHADALRHLERASLLLEDRAAGEDRDRAELAVRIQLAIHHLRTRGYAVDEVGTAYARARELAARIPAPREYLVASWGLAAHHLVRSEHRAAITIAAGLLALGEQRDDPVARLTGHQATGVPSFYMGRPIEAAHHLQRTLELARALPPDVLARFPQDVELGAMAFLAIARWLLGEEADAEALRGDAVRRATQLGGYDEVFVRMVSAQLGVLRRSVGQVLTDSSRIIEVCGPAGFGHIAASARVFGGWARSMNGDPATGLPLMDQGLAYITEHERGAHRLLNLTLRAEALGFGGRADDAAAAITEAIAELDLTEERFYAPETWMVAARLRPHDPRLPTWLAHASAEAEAAGAVPLRRRVTDLATGSNGSGTSEDDPAPERGAVLST